MLDHKWCKPSQTYSIISVRSGSEECTKCGQSLVVFVLSSLFTKSNPVCLFSISPPVHHTFVFRLSGLSSTCHLASEVSFLYKHRIKMLQRGVESWDVSLGADICASYFSTRYFTSNQRVFLCLFSFFSCSLSSPHNGKGRTAETQDYSFMFAL